MPREKTLSPVRPSRAIEGAYRERLDRLVGAMIRSTDHWLTAAYRRNEPHLARDELPATALTRRMRQLGRYWQRKFDALAPDLARWVAVKVPDRSDASLRSILRRGGLSVRFKMGRAAQDVLRATIEENVSLIRSIPPQHFGRIEGAVLTA